MTHREKETETEKWREKWIREFRIQSLLNGRGEKKICIDKKYYLIFSCSYVFMCGLCSPVCACVQQRKWFSNILAWLGLVDYDDVTSFWLVYTFIHFKFGQLIFLQFFFFLLFICIRLHFCSWCLPILLIQNWLKDLFLLMLLFAPALYVFVFTRERVTLP